MNVLFLVTAYARDEHDVITPWMVETIRHLGERGVGVEVLAPSYRGLGEQVVGGVRVHRFRYAPRAWETLTHDQTAPDRIRERPWFLGLVPGYVAAGSRAAARLARSGRFDVVHAFWPLPQGVLGVAAKRASGLPLVSTFFGVELTWMERQFPFLAPTLRGIVRASDAVTAISTYTAGRLARVVPGADPDVIPFGAAVEAPAAPPPPRPRAGRPFELLFVGRLVERKGVPLLLEALAALAGRDVVLHVVGDGPDRAALEARAAALGVSARAVFHGFVSREEKEARFAACDAFVLPAVIDAKGDTEGLGVVLLEAMSYARPVIASAAGGIVDIVRDGRNGWLVPPGDAAALARAVEEAADDPARAEAYGRAGRDDVAAGFSWPAIAERLHGVYRRVTERRATARPRPAADGPACRTGSTPPSGRTGDADRRPGSVATPTTLAPAGEGRRSGRAAGSSRIVHEDSVPPPRGTFAIQPRPGGRVGRPAVETNALRVSRTDTSAVEPRYLALLEAERAGWWSSDNFDTWKNLYVSEYARGFYVVETLAKYVPDFRAAGARVLDIGCGDAGVLIAFAERGARTAGIELDEKSLERGRLRAEEHGVEVDLRSGIAEALPWGDASFDLVILDNVLEHVTDRAKTLDEIHRVLAPGGLLYMVTPKPLSAYSLWNDPHYDLAGLVLMPRDMQIWYFEKVRGGGAGTYDVGVIPTRFSLRRMLRWARFEPVVSPRELWVNYLRNRIARPEEVRPGLKRRLSSWLARREWPFTNPLVRWFWDVSIGSNFFIARRVP